MDQTDPEPAMTLENCMDPMDDQVLAGNVGALQADLDEREVGD